MTDINKIASACMNDPRSAGWHQLAGGAAKTAALDTLDKRTRDIYRFEEGKALLFAVFNHKPELTTAEMLQVAAEVAERANA